ncbi:hypothetical protein ACR6HW_02195 [Fusibacter sp. JL298sf-3]
MKAWQGLLLRIKPFSQIIELIMQESHLLESLQNKIALFETRTFPALEFYAHDTSYISSGSNENIAKIIKPSAYSNPMFVLLDENRHPVEFLILID